MTLLLVIPLYLYPQDTENQNPPISQRLFLGGSFGLQFGSVTNIELSPVAGLWLLPRLTVAAGPSFQFYKDEYDQTLIYGVRTYSQFFIVQDFNNIIPANIHFGLFLQGEYDGLSLERSFFDSNAEETGRTYQGTFFAGAGVSQPAGPHSSVDFTFLWPLSDSGYDVSSIPEFRINITF